MRKLSWLLASLLVLSALGAMPAAAAADFELILQPGDDGTVVTGYSGTVPPALEIPAGVTAIQADAFSHCVELKELTLPEGLRTVDRAAFSSCTHLSVVSWPSTLETIGNAAFYNTALTELVLPASLTTLSYGAFSGCTKLHTVRIPAGLETIGTNAFRGCTRLQTVEIPNGVRYLGGSCFADCDELESLKLPDTLMGLQDAVFKGSGLRSLDIPEGPTALNYTFDACSNLESLTIPASVVEIYGNVFRKCSSLKTIRYGGTREAWEKALACGNSAVSSAVEVMCQGEPAPSEPPLASVSPGPGGAQYPTLRADSGLTIAAERHGSILTGVQIGRGGSFTSVAAVAGAFDVPDGASVEITAEGSVCDPVSPIATGDLVLLCGTDGRVQEVTVVISGDVLGTGLLDISQVVRMARSLSGAAPLEGPYLTAGCLVGGDTVSIADLVRLAQMLSA